MRFSRFDKLDELIVNTCNAIDVRTVLVETSEDQLCLGANVRFTRQSIDDVRTTHEDVHERLGALTRGTVSIVLHASSLDEKDELLGQLSEGQIDLNSNTWRIDSKLGTLTAAEFQEYPRPHLATPDSDYDHIVVHAATTDTLETRLRELGIEPVDLGLNSWSDINSWLGFDLTGQNIGFVVAIPIYMKIAHPLAMKDGIVLGPFKSSRWLLDNCDHIGLHSHEWNGRAIERKELKIEESSDDDGMIFGAFTAHFNLDPDRWDSSVRFESRLPGGDVAAYQTRSVRQLLRPAEQPLFAAFKRFDGADKLRDRLLNPTGKSRDSDFAAAVEWLFEIAGARVLDLSRITGAEQLRNQSQIEGTADLVAEIEHESRITLLLVDCTTRVPDGSKLDKIAATEEALVASSETLFAELNVKTVPVVVTSKTAENTKKRQVQLPMVLDRGDLGAILGHLESSGPTDALELICGLLGLLPPRSPNMPEFNLP